MGVRSKSYSCKCCGISFRLAYEVKFCPYCGAESIEVDGKSRNTALKMIEDHNRLISLMLEKFDEYAKVHAEIENIRAKLKSYKARGLISEEEMPSFAKPKLIDYLKYRQNNRKK